MEDIFIFRQVLLIEEKNLDKNKKSIDNFIKEQINKQSVNCKIKEQQLKKLISTLKENNPDIIKANLKKYNSILYKEYNRAGSQLYILLEEDGSLKISDNLKYLVKGKESYQYFDIL